MKKLLFITPFLPSSRTAGQHYTLRLLHKLSNFCSVDVCLFHYPKEAVPVSFGKARVVRSFRTSTLRMVGSAFKIPFLHPIFSSRFRIDLARFLLKSREKYDYFYLDFSQTFVYSFFLRRKKTFLMSHDVVTQLFRRRKGLLNGIGAALCRLSEGLILRYSGGQIMCFSAKDQRLILKYAGRQATVVDFIIDDRIGGIDYHTVSLQRTLCFYGAWHRRENSEGLEWFLDNVAPRADRTVRFIVIGGGMPGTIVEKIDRHPNVRYAGFVDNPYTLLADSQALLAPLFSGAGVKVKVIEALASGTPVIGSSLAFEGIELVESLPVFECNSVEDYLRAIDRVNSFTSKDKSSFRIRFASSYPRRTFEQILSGPGL